MNKLILSFASLLLASNAFAQLNTFSDGDILSAEKMNQNFQALINSNVLRSTSVNCDGGETINGAIESGYNDITVSGTCNENLLYTVWRDWDLKNKSDKLAPRYLKITGADSTAKIMDTTSNTENTISVNSGVTLILDKITVSGGKFGVSAVRNSNLLMTGGVRIENFSERGIRVDDSSYLGVDEDGVTISGGSDSEFGIYLGTGSSGWIHTANISGSATGVNLYGGSFLYLYDFMINASERGIGIYDQSTVLKIDEGVGVIEGTSDKAITVGRASFYSWDPGALTIHNLNGGLGIGYYQSDGVIYNLKMPDFNNFGSGWRPALELSAGSSVSMNGAEISGSTDGALVSISDGSITKIEDSTLTASSASNAIDANGSTRLVLRNTTISGSVTDSLVNIAHGSSVQIRNSSSISGSVDNDALVNISHGSTSEIRDSTLTLNSGNQAVAVKEGSNLEIWSSTLSGTATEELVDVRRVSNAIIRNETTLSQTNSESPDVRVSNLSFLSVWSDSSINSVACHMKGTVSADEGTVADLETGCTE